MMIWIKKLSTNSWLYLKRKMKTELSSQKRERLQKLADSIQENDNDYILYAKLR